jgi:hypothetical protein
VKLSDIIDGETWLQFERRVEEFYDYEFKRHDRWVLFGGDLIVAHPEKAPLTIHQDGSREEIKPAHVVMQGTETRQ